MRDLLQSKVIELATERQALLKALTQLEEQRQQHLQQLIGVEHTLRYLEGVLQAPLVVCALPSSADTVAGEA